MTNTVKSELGKLMANTYALYLKTQNFHWHVRGKNFISLHEFLEGHYKSLAEAVDGLAERIVMLGGQAPATFTQLEQLSTIKAGDSNTAAEQMLAQLADDHASLIDDIKALNTLADGDNDLATCNVCAERIDAHEKMRWMLASFAQ
jgi:starvation-inducible DNA-binding protein